VLTGLVTIYGYRKLLSLYRLCLPQTTRLICQDDSVWQVIDVAVRCSILVCQLLKMWHYSAGQCCAGWVSGWTYLQSAKNTCCSYPTTWYFSSAGCLTRPGVTECQLNKLCVELYWYMMVCTSLRPRQLCRCHRWLETDWHWQVLKPGIGSLQVLASERGAFNQSININFFSWCHVSRRNESEAPMDGNQWCDM